MDNRENRWVAGILLLAMFGVIAYAGSRAAPKVQTTQNVLVTNSSSQPIPIAARPGTGAYIVSVANAPSVNVRSSPTTPIATKEVNTPEGHSSLIDGSLSFNAGNTSASSAQLTLSSVNQTVIDTVNVSSRSIVSGEYAGFAQLFVYDHLGSEIGVFGYVLAPGINNYSSFDTRTSIPVPANGSIIVGMVRGASSDSTLGEYSVVFHTVPNP